MTSDAPQTPTASSRPQSPWLWLGALLLLNLGAPFLPVPNAPVAMVAGVVLVVVYVVLIVGFAFSVAHLKPSPLASAAMILVCALAYGAIERGMRPVTAEFLELARLAGARPSPLQRFALDYVNTLQDLVLIGGASFLGALGARAIRHPNMIGPIGAVLGVVDIIGVLFSGPVARMMTSTATAPLAERALTSGPVAGSASASQTGFSVAVPHIGVGDFLFLAFFACVLVKCAMNWKPAMKLIAVLVALTLLAVNFVPALPGLVPIGIGAVAPNLKYFSYTRDEKFALGWAALLVAVLTGALYFAFQSALPN